MKFNNFTAALPFAVITTTVIGLIVLFVYAMIGLEKVSSLVWGLSNDREVDLGDKKITYTSFDLNVMRLFIVVTIISLVANSITSFITTRNKSE